MFYVINFNMCTRFILCPLCPTCYSRRADRAHTGVSLLRLCDQNLFRTTKAAQSQSVKLNMSSVVELYKSRKESVLSVGHEQCCGVVQEQIVAEY